MSGADVRLWVSSCDYSQDVSISENILKQVSDAYRRFRNTFRFLLGNLNDFTPDDFVGDWDALEPLDQWAMVRLSQLLADVEAAYESYRFNSVYRALYDYVNDISAVYM
ncbi:MAG: class I tRNA ligase family protein, partial [Adlercreutzia equolifaciens]